MKLPTAFSLIVALAVSGCGKAPESAESPAPEATAEEIPLVVATTPEPTPELAAPTPEPIDTSTDVAILGYHRFENPPRDPLAISTAAFRQQMQALKDAGITVIPMADFLAWRRGEKNIPARSAVITMDDGYVSCYTEAWPVLKEFGYPSTMYVYTNYISAGGKSITWEQLAEMRDGGVDIGSHSISHDNMARPKRSKDTPYDEWLWAELKQSKDELEQKLGIPIRTFAYPFGIHNDVVMQKGIEAGYEALFTVSGRKALHDSNPAAIGRFIVQSDKEFTFTNALKPRSGGGSTIVQAVADGAPGSTTADAARSMGPTIITRPSQGEEIGNAVPLIEADLRSFENIDPASVEMRVSGFGLVPAIYDPTSRVVRFPMHQKLREPEVSVVVQARSNGKRIQTAWTFRVNPKVAVPEAAAVPALPADESNIPEMVPAA